MWENLGYALNLDDKKETQSWFMCMISFCVLSWI